jgi:2-hydroxy-3-keto-5-methylthiopentenyl-1-phosphate phosphatase
MCDERTEELERMVKEQREMIDKLMAAHGSSFKDTIESKKEKADETFKSVFAIFTNKEIQRHFVKAGMEFLSGIEEIIKAIPVPDSVREKMDMATEAKDDFVKDVVCDLNPSCKYKAAAGKKKMKKIDVE